MKHIQTAAASEKPALQIQNSVISLIGPILFLGVFIALFAMLAVPMGLSNMLNTVMNTAYRLLIDTCFYLMAIAVLMGALSALFSEFGVVDLLNRLLSPLMKPIYGLPGAAALGVVSTYLSDNPAILTLANDPKYRRCYKPYQIPALTNIGTSFGMGLIVTTFVLSLNTAIGPNTVKAVLCGNLGAVAGSIVSTRLMLRYTKREIGYLESEPFSIHGEKKDEKKNTNSATLRFLDAVMAGGREGVNLGLAIIPGVVVICTIVMMLTYGAPAEGGYTGAAYEGIALLPRFGNAISFLLKPLFGFSSASNIAVPITALGSAGAALGIIPSLLENGMANANDIAVFAAICMCWSGFLSTHVSMMDVLNYRRFTGKAILYHTIGGLFAGVAAHWLFVLVTL